GSRIRRRRAAAAGVGRSRRGGGAPRRGRRTGAVRDRRLTLGRRRAAARYSRHRPARGGRAARRPGRGARRVRGGHPELAPPPPDAELEDVRWFDRAELAAAVAGEGEIHVPPPLAIARRLIDDWLADRPR